MSQILGTISALGGSVVVPAGGGSAIAVTIEGTWTDTLSFQISYDNGGTWNAVNLSPIGGGAAVASVTGNGTWSGSVGVANLFQIISTGGSHTGTATVYINTGALGVTIVQGPLAPGSTGNTQNPIPMGAIDGSGNVQLVNCNQDIATPLLVLTGRTQTSFSAVQTGNRSAKGVIIYLDVTGGGGGAGLTANLFGYDPVSGNSFTIFTDPGAVTTQGVFPIRFYPGIGTPTTHSSGACPLPPTWQLKMQAGDTTSFTYSVGASLIA